MAACLINLVTSFAYTAVPGLTKLNGVVAGTPYAMMLDTRLASAWTGQNQDIHAVWNIVAPRCPFFWFSRNKVTEWAPAKDTSGAVLGIIVLSCRRNVTSWTRNGTVRVVRVPRVYSPTRRRKKKAVVTKSAVALIFPECGLWQCRPASSIVATGRANWGLEGGSTFL
jgi:hypothetical protein